MPVALLNHNTTIAGHGMIKILAQCDLFSTVHLWTLNLPVNTLFLVTCQITQKLLGLTSKMFILAVVADLVNQFGKRVVHITKQHRPSTGRTLCVVEIGLAGLAHNVP